jgi:hypothetical protein
VSPALHVQGHVLALVISLPGPTAMTLPLVGFSLAESGSRIPLAVLVLGFGLLDDHTILAGVLVS